MPQPPNKATAKVKRGPKLSPLSTPLGNGEAEQAPTPPANLDDKCAMTFDGKPYEVRAEELVRIKELGRGGYGIVETMLHPPSGTIMAVKRIHVTVNNEEQKRMLIELNASMKSGQCPFMVRFYGAMFREGDVWICMEVMDTSLDKFYRMAVDQRESIPEPVISKITYAVIAALHYMKEELKLMHRDVKPSNILINRKGEVKICDFGISGHLTDSIAKTINAGCKPYMAPERINPHDQAIQSYDIRSDVWSLGITLIEIATGTHPYARCKTPFEQLKQVVVEPPPHLPDRFSPEFVEFVDSCLKKEYRQRPKYLALLEKPFVVKYMQEEVDVAGFVNRIFAASAASSEFGIAAAANAASAAFARQQILQQGLPSASPTPPVSSSDEAPLTGSPSKEVRLPQGVSNSPSPSTEESGPSDAIVTRLSEQVLSPTADS